VLEVVEAIFDGLDAQERDAEGNREAEPADNARRAPCRAACTASAIERLLVMSTAVLTPASGRFVRRLAAANASGKRTRVIA
jgi:hypothetical protein